MTRWNRRRGTFSGLLARGIWLSAGCLLSIAASASADAILQRGQGLARLDAAGVLSPIIDTAGEDQLTGNVDGSAYAYVASRSGATDVLVVRRGVRVVRAVSADTILVVSWDPSGRAVAAATDRGLVLVDSSSGAIQQVALPVALNGSGAEPVVRWAVNGSRLVAAVGGRAFVVTKTGVVAALGPSGALVGNAWLSPNGLRVAYLATIVAHGVYSSSAYVASSTGAGAVRVVTPRGRANGLDQASVSAVWAGDSTELAVLVGSETWVVNRLGQKPVRPLVVRRGSTHPLGAVLWSPSGHALVYADRFTRKGTWRWTRATGPRRLLTMPTLHLHFSPDGRSLAAVGVAASSPSFLVSGSHVSSLPLWVDGWMPGGARVYGEARVGRAVSVYTVATKALRRLRGVAPDAIGPSDATHLIVRLADGNSIGIADALAGTVVPAFSDPAIESTFSGLIVSAGRPVAVLRVGRVLSVAPGGALQPLETPGMSVPPGRPVSASPDGTRLAFMNAAGGFVLSPTGVVVAPHTVRIGSSVTWSSDSTRLLSQNRVMIADGSAGYLVHRPSPDLRYDYDGTWIRQLGSPRPVPAPDNLGTAVWSPDSRRLAFLVDDGAGGMDLISVEATTGARTRVGGVSASHAFGDLAWAPDSTHVAVVGPSALVGDATVADSLVPFTAPVDATGRISWSPDGAYVLVWGTATGTHVADAGGSSQSTIASADGDLAQPVWSPDAGMVAFSLTAPPGTATEYLYRRDGTLVGRLPVIDAGGSGTVAWWLTPTAGLVYQPRLTLFDVAGAFQSRPLISPDFLGGVVATSADGQRAFVSNGGRLAMVTIATGAIVELGPDTVVSPG